MKPLIGVTTDYDPGKKIKTRTKSEGIVYIRDAYLDAVKDHGGLPVALPLLEDKKLVKDLAARLSGVLVTGGDFDIHPRHYGEKPIPELGRVKENRTFFEFALIREAFRLDMPVLGICGGMQAINVAAGGTLHQDIKVCVPGAISHEQGQPKTRPSHKAEVMPGTILAGAMFSRKVKGPKNISINSTHHQAVAKPGRGIKISALSPDGIIEAIESERHSFVVGVQWHPELLYSRHPEQSALFRAFVNKAAKGARG